MIWKVAVAGQRVKLGKPQLDLLAIVGHVTHGAEMRSRLPINAEPDEHADAAVDIDDVRLQPVIAVVRGLTRKRC